MGDSLRLPSVDEAILNAFNRHGHPFHQAVSRECRRLRQLNASFFEVDAEELPVQVGGVDLHVDLVLRCDDYGLLVVECKRANPALACWAFGRSAQYSDARYVALEKIRKVNAQTSVERVLKHSATNQYHVAIEVKNQSARGDASGGGRGDLDGAITQALRGCSGVISTTAKHIPLMVRAPQAVVVPVVVTTADLYAFDGDLSQADLATGTLPAGTSSRRDWLWFRAMASTSLRHEIGSVDPASHDFRTLGALQHWHHARSVAIVNHAGLGDFLTRIPEWMA